MKNLSHYFIASESNNYRPAVLSYKAFLIYGILLLLLRIFLGTITVESAAVDSSTLMEMINEERENRNLNTLFTHSALVKAAGQKSQDMIDRDYFNHIDPDGNYIWEKIIAAGYTPYKILGENLAVDFSTSEGMIKAWLDSPSHRTNLLHPDFKDQGLVALFGDYNGRYTNLTTSLFGTLFITEQPASPPPSAPPVKPPVQGTTTPPAQEPNPEPIPEKPETTPTTTPSSSTPISEITSSTTPPLLNTAGDQANNFFSLFLRQLSENKYSAANISRFIFTLFGLFLLGILTINSVIISRHELILNRSYHSYHIFILVLITLVSILVWWW